MIDLNGVTLKHERGLILKCGLFIGHQASLCRTAITLIAELEGMKILHAV